jgi:hypothetical protein
MYESEERTSFWTSFKRSWGATEGDEPEVVDEEESLCFELTFKERVIGFAATYLFGLLCSVLSWFSFGDWKAFGILSTAGNLSSLGGTMFLMGPVRQLRRMFDPQRVVATVVMLTSMVGTFVAAMALKSAFLTFICSIIQYLALIWYSLSYIPYARDIVIRFFGYCWNSSKRSLDEPI